jgi:glucan endo-1,3-beta-D-glucosidase
LTLAISWVCGAPKLGDISGPADPCILGFDGYPYFQDGQANAIGNGKTLFHESLAATVAAANGKEVWITETGWPVSGKDFGQAVPSLENARTFWKEVGCPMFGVRNVWWYTFQDSAPATPNPSFGLISSDLASKPLYDLSCKGVEK